MDGRQVLLCLLLERDEVSIHMMLGWWLGVLSYRRVTVLVHLVGNCKGKKKQRIGKGLERRTVIT